MRKRENLNKQIIIGLFCIRGCKYNSEMKFRRLLKLISIKYIPYFIKTQNCYSSLFFFNFQIYLKLRGVLLLNLSKLCQTDMKPKKKKNSDQLPILLKQFFK